MFAIENVQNVVNHKNSDRQIGGYVKINDGRMTNKLGGDNFAHLETLQLLQTHHIYRIALPY